ALTRVFRASAKSGATTAIHWAGGGGAAQRAGRADRPSSSRAGPTRDMGTLLVRGGRGSGGAYQTVRPESKGGAPHPPCADAGPRSAGGGTRTLMGRAALRISSPASTLSHATPYSGNGLWVKPLRLTGSGDSGKANCRRAATAAC